MNFQGTVGMESFFLMFWTYLPAGPFLLKESIEIQTKYLLSTLILKKSWVTWKNSHVSLVDTFGLKLKLYKEMKM